jgi:hypothetical protein
MYIITARRMISGEVLKYRNGLRIGKGYETGIRRSSDFPLTLPHRLFGPIGHIPPAEAEANYYAARKTLDMVA